MSKKDINKAAWEQLRKDGYVVDAQVYDDGVADVGIADEKSRTFAHPKAYVRKQYRSRREAERDTHAQARAISRMTGLPVHHTISPDRQKQVSSHTMRAAECEYYWKWNRRHREEAAQAEFEGGFLGKLATVVAVLLVAGVAYGGCFLVVWVMSLL